MRCIILLDSSTPAHWAEECIASFSGTSHKLSVLALFRDESRRAPLRFLDQNEPTCFLLEKAEQLRLWGVAVILNLTSEDVPPAWAQAVPQGVWFFRFGDQHRAAHSFGRREVFKGAPLQKVTLERFTPDVGQRHILKRGWFKSSLRSLKVHRRSILSQCANWPAALLPAIEQRKNVLIDIEQPEPVKASDVWIGLTWPLLSVLRNFTALAKKIRSTVCYQQWNIGIVRTSSLQEGRRRPEQVQWLDWPDWPNSYADPFLVNHSGKKYLFVERYNFWEQRGYIAALSLDCTQSKAEVTLDFDSPVHVSYPCLYQDNETLYCLPEILSAQEIAVYRCEVFPNKWAKCSVISTEGAFADPTLFKKDGLWWVLATKYDKHSGGNASLYAWYAEDIGSEWKPHLRNPIKCDASSARAAGSVYQSEGKWLRPSQDCSRRYGESVVINQIVKLTPDDFEESFFERLIAHKDYPTGLHHLAQDSEITIIDGRREMPALSAAFFKIKYRSVQMYLNWGARRRQNVKQFQQKSAKNLKVSLLQESFNVSHGH